MAEKPRILIVEDEKRIARFMQMELEHEGYRCTIEYDGGQALDRIGQEHFDLVLLDFMLPDMNGAMVCKRAREISQIPIMIVSAKDDVDAKVECLDLGADDYITKPFNSKELFARIRVLLRAKTEPHVSTTLHLQDITLYLDRHEVRVNGKLVVLTKKEFDFLAYLIRRKNCVIPREQLLEEVWGYDYMGNTNVIEVFVRYVRNKIGDRQNGKQYIRTVRGVGYVANED